MIKRFINQIRDENGTIMIESTYCMLAAMIVMIFIVGLGFIYYQHVMFVVACDQVAEEVVQTYKLKNVTHNVEVTQADVEHDSLGFYRYLWGTIQSSSQDHLEVLVNERLSQTSFALDGGNATVEIVPHIDDIGRRHYAVTITKPYKTLFSNFFNGSVFKALKIDNNMTTTVYVEGTDISHITNTVDFTLYGMRFLEKWEVTGIISSFCSLFNTIWKFFT